MLAQEVAMSERTLRRAVSQGTIRGTRPSPRKLDLSQTERQYIRRSWPLLSALRQALRTEQDVRFALLFGSASIGEDTPESDIDLLVDARCPSLDRIVDLGAKLTSIVGRRVDIVRLEDAATAPSFLGEILADGRVLVDREQVWPQLHACSTALSQTGRQQEVLRVRAALAGIDQYLGLRRHPTENQER